MSTALDNTPRVAISKPCELGQVSSSNPPGFNNLAHLSINSAGANKCSITSKLTITSTDCLLPTSSVSNTASIGFCTTFNPLSLSVLVPVLVLVQRLLQIQTNLSFVSSSKNKPEPGPTSTSTWRFWLCFATSLRTSSTLGLNIFSLLTSADAGKYEYSRMRSFPGNCHSSHLGALV